MSEKCAKVDLSLKLYVLGFVLVLGLSGFFGMSIYEMYKSSQVMMPQGVSVEGKGIALVSPDIARITLGVNTRAITSEEAFKSNTEMMNKVTEKILANGVEKKDIQTLNYYLYQDFNYIENQGSVPSGYVLDQSVSVKVRDFEKIGKIISDSASVGANALGGVEFYVEDMNNAKALAREDAVEKAKQNAIKIQELTGIKLGQIIGYYEYQDYYGGDAYGKGGYAVEESMVMESPSLMPGQQEVVYNVNLTYALK